MCIQMDTNVFLDNIMILFLYMILIVGIIDEICPPEMIVSRVLTSNRAAIQ